MAQGTVRSGWSARKGLWVHRELTEVRTFSSTSSAIQADGFKSLDEGQRVEFDVTQGQKGPRPTGSSRRLAAPAPTPFKFPEPASRRSRAPGRTFTPATYISAAQEPSRGQQDQLSRDRHRGQPLQAPRVRLTQR